MKQNESESYHLQGFNLDGKWEDITQGYPTREDAEDWLPYIKENYGFMYTGYQTILTTTVVHVQVVNSTSPKN